MLIAKVLELYHFHLNIHPDLNLHLPQKVFF